MAEAVKANDTVGGNRRRDGMDRELEYLVRVCTDAVRAGTVKGFARKASARVQGNCRRKH